MSRRILFKDTHRSIVCVKGSDEMSCSDLIYYKRESFRSEILIVRGAEMLWDKSQLG